MRSKNKLTSTNLAPPRLTKYSRLEDHEGGSDYGSSRSRFWFNIQRETQFR
jgi:hypothetical protein